MPWDLRLITPFNYIISGSSQSGKTNFIKRLLENKDDLMTVPPSKVFLFYKLRQEVYNEMVSTNLVNELTDVSSQFPSLDEIQDMVKPYKDNGGSLIIFDDILSDITKDFQQLFCNASHHLNCSIIFVTQNLFQHNQFFRTMSLNSHYFTIMRNARDKQQISILGKQFSPNNVNYVVQSYTDATKTRFSYLLLDFHPNSNPSIGLRSRIFPEEFPTTVYLEK